jgi:hypothetical protein
MNRLIQFIFIFTLGVIVSLNAQTTIADFDSAAVDSIFEENVEGAASRIEFTDDYADFVQGTGALDVNYVIGEYHPWGSFANVLYRLPDSTTMDWSVSDSFSIWIKVEQAPTHPEYMVFRMHIVDQPSPGVPTEEYIYEHTTIIDATADWYELQIPFIERETDGTTVPNDSGFVLMPTTWGGGTYNNSKLDRNKIFGYNLSAVTTGWTAPANIPADSVRVSYDNFTRFGARAVPFVIFTGMVFPSTFRLDPWGGSTVSIEQGAGVNPLTDAVNWTQGNEWGNGWTGFALHRDLPVEPWNMLGSWMSDSVKFQMKAPAGTGELRIQFESGSDGKVGLAFTPIGDDQWHDYSFALRDLVYQDGTSNFDTTAVITVNMLANGTAVAGTAIYIDDWWTGNPIIDNIAPARPLNVAAFPDPTNNFNLIAWENVPGEEGEIYAVVASPNPISDDLNDPAIEWVASGLAEGTQSYTHLLRYPLSNQSVSYYYAVICTDEFGNEGLPGLSPTSYTNTALGIPTISLNVPSNFIADGDLTEWYNSGNMYWELKPSTDNVATGSFTNDDDLTGIVFLAIDDDYLYVAADVIDDVFDGTASSNWWEYDALQIFIGLYDQRGPAHTSFGNGSEPDYELVFKEYEATRNGEIILTPDSSGYHFEGLNPDYLFEAKISLDAIKRTDDDRFHPARGMKIPMDLYFHDRDATGWEGNLAWSPYNTDQAHISPTQWFYSWIGDTTLNSIEDELNDVARSFKLYQNYPNPFNPVTSIEYSIPSSEKVKIDIYNVLGQNVLTLVNQNQKAGNHVVTFDATDFSSGVYFYRIQAGSNIQTKKMILMK